MIGSYHVNDEDLGLDLLHPTFCHGAGSDGAHEGESSQELAE
jgi:hypothetical protein